MDTSIQCKKKDSNAIVGVCQCLSETHHVSFAPFVHFAAQSHANSEVEDGVSFLLFHFPLPMHGFSGRAP